MKRRLAIAALVLLGLGVAGQAFAWPPGEGAYVPSPGGERWLYSMLAHKIRVDRSALWLLDHLLSDPATAKEFASIERSRLLQATLVHDYSKVHPDEMRGRLPVPDYLPELFAGFLKDGVKPAPWGSVPADADFASLSPQKKMRWVVDRMNDADTLIENYPLEGLPAGEAEKYRFIIFILDSADTSLMRTDYTTHKGLSPSEFVELNRSNPAWASRLRALGQMQKYVESALRWVEEESPGGMSRYFEHNSDHTDALAVPMLKESECLRGRVRVLAW